MLYKSGNYLASQCIKKRIAIQKNSQGYTLDDLELKCLKDNCKDLTNGECRDYSLRNTMIDYYHARPE